jgi:hypothetical protein
MNQRIKGLGASECPVTAYCTHQMVLQQATAAGHYQRSGKGKALIAIESGRSLAAHLELLN